MIKEISRVIKYVIFASACFMILSGFVYITEGKADNDKWFSRTALGLILLGITGILIELKSIREK